MNEERFENISILICFIYIALLTIPVLIYSLVFVHPDYKWCENECVNNLNGIFENKVCTTNIYGNYVFDNRCCISNLNRKTQLGSCLY